MKNTETNTAANRAEKTTENTAVNMAQNTAENTAENAAQNTERTHWLPTWGCALLDTQRENLPEARLEEGAVIRQLVRITSGGEVLRLEISNEYGKAPLDIVSVHIALPESGDWDSRINPDTDTALTFSGRESVSIPAGESVRCDVTHLALAERGRLVITMKLGKSVPYFPETDSSQVTGHPGSRTNSYIARFRSVSDADMFGAEVQERWYYIANLEVLAPEDTRAIVCFGDSITDGYGCTVNMDDRWTDVLADAISAGNKKYSVINRGIGGNSIATGGLGEHGAERFDRDVIGTPNAEYVIVFAGINDVGEAENETDAMLRAEKAVRAYGEFIKKARTAGLTIYGATLTPVGGHYYCFPAEEKARRYINDWIRENTNTAAPGECGYDSALLDGYFDFETLLADPSDGTRLLKIYSNDNLHPSIAGYEKIGRFVYETLFGYRLKTKN